MAAHVQIRFLRTNALPPGTRYHVLWNGQVDSDNGDGKPADNPADPVDESNPLTGQAIEVWPSGKAGDGLGRDGLGIDGFAQSYARNYGDGYGYDGIGEDGLYTDYVTWTTESVLPALRDGAYKFAVRLEDQYGTVQTEALDVQSITIEGDPRPPSLIAFDSYSAGNLNLSWRHSPDLV